MIKQYRQVKPDSDKSSRELTIQLEKYLSKAPFIGRLGNDIYYLYYLWNEKIDLYWWKTKNVISFFFSYAIAFK